MCYAFCPAQAKSMNGSQESVEAAAWQLEAQNKLLSWIHKAALAILFILQH